MTNEVERKAALKRQSDDCMALAKEKAAAGLEREAGATAYEAGYFALMTALTAAEVRRFPDHPSVKAAELAATRQGMAENATKLTIEGATAYYSADCDVFVKHDWSTWAMRVRRSVGWGS